MDRASIQGGIRSSASSHIVAKRIGCVSFLNALPLIDGLADSTAARVSFDVPSGLLEDLEAGDVNIALCPVIDFQRSTQPLAIVPVGGIGCDGKTLTVRLYSKQPLDDIDAICCDTDSHTSVALVQIVMDAIYGRRPRIINYNAREKVAAGKPLEWPDTMLLIGDKVVTDSPPAVRYPHQLDLGEAWKQITGLPFVFAVWMCRADADLGELPQLLSRTRQHNASRIDEIVADRAAAHHWPTDLATRYLGQWLKYDIGPRQLEAIRLFYDRAHALGLTPGKRPLCLHGS